MLNALPYVLLILTFGLLAYVRQYTEGEKTLGIDVISVMIFVCFFGFRGFIFYDWTSYYIEFQTLDNISSLFSLDISEWRWEPGFTIIASLCKSIYPNYFFFQFVLTCINTTLLVTFLKEYQKNLPFGLMIFLIMGGIVLSTDLLRNSLTILLFAYSLRFIINKKPIPYFFICLLCVTIHSSSIVYFLLYFILNRKYSKWFLISIFIVANLIYLLHLSILESIVLLFVDVLAPSTKLWIQEYLQMDAALGNVLSLGYLERLLTGFLLFIFIDKLRAKRKGNDIFINSLVIYLFLALFLSEFRTISLRCSIIFAYSYWILWIDFLDCFEIKNNKRLYILFLVIYGTLRTIGSCQISSASYYNILFTDQTYQERLMIFERNFDD